MEYYIVSASRWTEALQKQFGEKDQVHAIRDADVLTYIQVFGKAQVEKVKNGQWLIAFQN